MEKSIFSDFLEIARISTAVIVEEKSERESEKEEHFRSFILVDSCFSFPDKAPWLAQAYTRLPRRAPSCLPGDLATFQGNL